MMLRIDERCARSRTCVWVFRVIAGNWNAMTRDAMEATPTEAVPVTAASAATSPEASLSAERSERKRRLRLAILANVAIRPLALIVPFISVPLFLNYLGRERFGLFEVVGALGMWLAATDAGLGLGLLNRLQDCHVSRDRLLAQRYTSSVAIALLAIAIGLVAMTSILTPVIDWGRLFKAKDPGAAAELPWAVWLACALTFTGLISNLSGVIYTAYQEQHRATLWDALFRVLTLVACVLVVRTPMGLVGVIVASSGVSAVLRLLLTVHVLCFEKPWLRPRWSLFDWGAVRSTLSDGVAAFVLQMAFVAIYQTDRLIIGSLLGPEQNATYSIAARFFLLVYGGFMMVIMPLWPAYGDALRRGDVAWVRRGVRLALMTGCGGMLLCGLVLLVAGDWVFRSWTRDKGIYISSSLILALTATFVLRAWVDSRTIVLNSVAQFRPQAVFFVAHAVLNLVLALALAKPFGLEGVAWATPISALLTSAWGYPWLMRRCMAGRHAVAPGATAANGERTV